MSNWGPVVWMASYLKPGLGGIEAFVHDWGLAVILLTLLVRMVLFPLTVRQARFSWRSRAFSKALKGVQAKYKDQPDQLRQEMVKLQLEHKFNPLSMIGTAVLQMPVMAAVYAVFYHFGSDITSGFLPWVHALSQSDPWHVMPVLAALLGASGTLVPMIAPDTVETVQAMGKWPMMMIFFSMMVFFLWKAPVAIALYMGTSSLWGMIERTFLRSGFAVRKFKLNPQGAVAAAGAGKLESEAEIRKA